MTSAKLHKKLQLWISLHPQQFNGRKIIYGNICPTCKLTDYCDGELRRAIGNKYMITFHEDDALDCIAFLADDWEKLIEKIKAFKKRRKNEPEKL